MFEYMVPPLSPNAPEPMPAYWLYFIMYSSIAFVFSLEKHHAVVDVPANKLFYFTCLCFNYNKSILSCLIEIDVKTRSV